MWILKDQAEIRGNKWISKLDRSVLCDVGQEHKMLFLEQLGISTYLQSSGKEQTDVGFAPFTKTWYGWRNFKVVCTCGVDEIENDHDDIHDWKPFGFTRALQRVREFLQ